MACLILPWWLFLPAGIALLILFYGGKATKQLGFWTILGAGAVILWLGAYSILWYAPAQFLIGKTDSYTVTAADFPQGSAFGTSLEVRFKPQYGMPCKAQLYTTENIDSVKPGDTLTFSAAPNRPGGDDLSRRRYFRSIGVYSIFNHVKDIHITHCDSIPLRYQPKVWAKSLRKICAQLYEEETRAFMLALLTGDRSELTQTQQSEMTRAGVYHMIAISGLHVGFLMGILLKVPGDRRLKQLLVVPLLVGFCLMVGARPSVVRAVFMCSAAMLSPFFYRDKNSWASLRAALFLILLHNPFAILDVGLQLSFLAVAGILLVTTRLKNALTQKLPEPRWKPFKRIKSYICSTIAMTLGAQLFTLPLCVVYFGYVPIYVILANLLVLIWVEALFCLGVMSLAAYGIFPAIGSLIAAPTQWIGSFVLAIIKTIAWMPFCALLPSFHSVFWLVLVYGTAFLLWKMKSLRRYTAWYIAGLAALLVVFIGFNRAWLLKDGLAVQVLDVGQGECVLFLSDTEAVAADCGGVDAGDALADTLNEVGESHLDCLMLTHFDSDHMNGVAQLLERTTVDTILIPDVVDDSGKYSEIENLAKAYHITLHKITKDQTVSFGSAQMQVFAPVGADSDNNSGLSALVTMDDFSALVTGDMDADTELLLAQKEKLKPVNVLVVSHHGSKTSSGEEFLSLVKPKTAVISVGKNRYGHPTPEAIQRLRAAGSKVRRTDIRGTVTILPSGS